MLRDSLLASESRSQSRFFSAYSGRGSVHVCLTTNVRCSFISCKRLTYTQKHDKKSATATFVGDCDPLGGSPCNKTFYQFWINENQIERNILKSQDFLTHCVSASQTQKLFRYLKPLLNRPQRAGQPIRNSFRVQSVQG